MSNARKYKVLLTLISFVISIMLLIAMVNWLISHAVLIVVLGAIGGCGYYMVQRSPLHSGRRNLL